MKTYGYTAAFMAALSILMAFVQSPLWLIGGIFSLHLAWKILSKGVKQKSCRNTTKGKVIDIKANGTFLGGKHQPLYDSQIAYLDRIKTFKDLPPNFIHDVSPGDIIEINYNPQKPHIAYVSFE